MPKRNKVLAIKYSNAAIDFGRGEGPVPKPTSFDLSLGELCLLKGPNGVGKSTMLDLIYGTRSPTQGEVLVTHGMHPQIARLYQKDGLLERCPAIANLQIASGSAPAIAHVTALFGLDNHLSTPTFQLSGGQRKRLEFCRLVLSAKCIWLADEPTTGMDAEGNRG